MQLTPGTGGVVPGVLSALVTQPGGVFGSLSLPVNRGQTQQQHPPDEMVMSDSTLPQAEQEAFCSFSFAEIPYRGPSRRGSVNPNDTPAMLAP
jgi:hypothetical protein